MEDVGVESPVSAQKLWKLIFKCADTGLPLNFSVRRTVRHVILDEEELPQVGKLCIGT
jgi:hypothetical protein